MIRRGLLLLLLAGCGGERAEDDGRGEVPEVPAEAVDDGGQVRLTPAESAAAVRAVEAHSRRVHEEARRAGGAVEGAGERPPPPPVGPPPPRTRAECEAQAERAATPDERAVLIRICAHLPAAP